MYVFLNDVVQVDLATGACSNQAPLFGAEDILQLGYLTAARVCGYLSEFGRNLRAT